MSDKSDLNVLFLIPQKFALGQLVATPNALENLTHEDIQTALNRHGCGDWGTMDREDWATNEQALKDGSRLLSVYFSTAKVKFYIITEADRSSTCILLPEDY